MSSQDLSWAIGKRMKRALPFLAALATLSGCMTTEEVAALRLAEAAARAAPYEAWIGHPVEELTAVWGVPDREYRTNGTRFLVYVDPKVGTEFEVAFTTSAPPQTGVRIVLSFCRTTFEVMAGRITGWDVRGDDCQPPPAPPNMSGGYR